jgi:hypothetical protein
MNASQFEQLCNSAREAHASLRGCKWRERQNEAAILRSVLDQLCAARLARKNPRLQERRAELIKYCNATLGEYCL